MAEDVEVNLVQPRSAPRPNLPRATCPTTVLSASMIVFSHGTIHCTRPCHSAWEPSAGKFYMILPNACYCYTARMSALPLRTLHTPL